MSNPRLVHPTISQHGPWARGEPALVADGAGEGLHHGVALHQHHVVAAAPRACLLRQGILSGRRCWSRMCGRARDSGPLGARANRFVPVVADRALVFADPVRRVGRTRAHGQLVVPGDPPAVERRGFGGDDAHGGRSAERRYQNRADSDDLKQARFLGRFQGGPEFPAVSGREGSGKRGSAGNKKRRSRASENGVEGVWWTAGGSNS